MISKELLQCLNNHLTIDEVISSDKNRIDNNVYWSVKEIDILQSKNIYELSFQLKEWAFKNGFGLTSGLLNYSKTKIAVLENIDLLMPKISFTDNIEVEAIFKACQWILDNKEQK